MPPEYKPMTATKKTRKNLGPRNVLKSTPEKDSTKNQQSSPLPPLNPNNKTKCNENSDLKKAIWNNACSAGCKKNLQPDEITEWYWDLKQKRNGCPPSSSHFRTAKYRWEEQNKEQCNDCRKQKFIHPYATRGKHQVIGGGVKRKIVERWGKMWDSALSDLQFDRIVFENNPDAEQTYA
ncbi:unnamed protein product [Orchesella dallaii]|uniref:Zinc-binding domain-containing protein n=1 Tax=Orchesella dallaii TaxID=48710 RepID=A0ABP1RTT1_9HEXA